MKRCSILLLILFLFSSISSAITGEWTKKADMPTSRQFFATAAVDGKIYAFGGWVGEARGSYTAVLEVYDPATDKWEAKSSLPIVWAGHTASVVNGKIYLIDGWNWSYVSEVHEYDPATDSWTKKSKIPTPRGYAAASVVNDKIYVIGGELIDRATPLAIDSLDGDMQNIIRYCMWRS